MLKQSNLAHAYTSIATLFNIDKNTIRTEHGVMSNINYRLPPVKLSETILFHNEGILAREVQVLRAGKFIHNQEEFEITLDDLNSMVNNFNIKARGIDLMLDYSHDSEGKAAAWFHNLYVVNDNELWANVEWTETGATAVKRKEYRYISADFNYNYQDNETLEEYGPTLFGAALTNRPVVKWMTPTILSEQNIKTLSKEDYMTIEKLTKELADLQAKYDDLCNVDKTTKMELSEAKEEIKNVKLSEEKIKADVKLAEERQII